MPGSRSPRKAGRSRSSPCPIPPTPATWPTSPSTTAHARGPQAIRSCGAALHHAGVALAAEGWQVEVVSLPDPADPSHLAHLTIYDRQAAGPEAVRELETVQVRHTDRRAVTGIPITEGQL